MLATSQMGLKEYLNEAKDHKVVLEKIDAESGITYLYMAYPPPLLQWIVDQNEPNGQQQ